MAWEAAEGLLPSMEQFLVTKKNLWLGLGSHRRSDAGTDAR